MGFNKLLERQLKKYLPEEYRNQAALQQFIQAVNDSYEDYERDRKLFNHAFSLSEQEYITINKQLTDEIRLKHASIQQLKETIHSINATGNFNYSGTDDLGDVIEFLKSELEEKKKADELLKQSEKRLRLALQTIDDNVWEYNFDTRTMTFTNTDAAILPLDRTTFTGEENNTWWDTIVKEDLHIPVDTFRKYINGEISTHNVEYRVYTGDGGSKWVLNRGGVIKRNADGKPVKVIGSLTDIQHFKDIQHELSATANRFSVLLQNLQTAVLVEDENRKVVLTNKQFLDFFQVPARPEDLIGADCSASAEMSKQLFKDPDHFIARINELLDNRTLTVNEEVEMASGRVLERNYIPLFIDNEYQGHLWTYTDITERKLAEAKLRSQEEKYRSIIANMNLGLLEVDLHDRIRYVNQSFCNMSGYTEKELIGQEGSVLFLNGDARPVMREKNKLRSAGQSDAYELKVKVKHGELKWWLISGAPLYNSQQEHIGSIGIHLDITQQKLLEQQLLEAKQEAENSVHAKEIFLANMSHEIRTPMNAILGMSKQLQKTPMNQQQQSYLNIIGTAAENLLVIINDILDFTKIEAGKVDLEQIGFDLDELVHNAANVLKHKTEEKGLTFDINIDPSISRILKGDPHRINQVLMNLLSNSIKFTQHGTVGVHCRFLAQQEDSQLMELVVFDTGKGMDANFLKNLFNKFSQEDESITRSYGGTGLGMSIVKQLVELMGGSINVESEKGIGTQVYIQIAFPVGMEADLPQKNTTCFDANILAGKTILLAEDNEMNRMLAEMILRQYGATITEAGNGKEAVDAMQQHKFDLVLMDMQMPVMDGIEATRHIRKQISSATPIIALTANAVKGEMEKCLQAGMNDYLSKPFEEQDLVQLIAKWLGKTTHFQPVTPVVPVAPKTVYDLSNLRKISRGSEEFIQKMLRIFLKETPAAVEEIQQAYGKRNIERVQAVAHRIKPSLNSLNITLAAALAQHIEKGTWTSDNYEELGSMITSLQQSVAEVTALITRDHLTTASS